jgi:hypothetical protein
MTHPETCFRYTIITVQISTKSITHVVPLFANAVLMRQLLLQCSLTCSVHRTLKANILGFKRRGNVQRTATWWQFKQLSSVYITGNICILRSRVPLNMIIWLMVFRVVVAGEVLRSSLNMEMLAPTYQLYGVTSQTSVIFTFTTFYHEGESIIFHRNVVCIC